MPDTPAEPPCPSFHEVKTRYEKIKEHLTTGSSVRTVLVELEAWKADVKAHIDAVPKIEDTLLRMQTQTRSAQESLKKHFEEVFLLNADVNNVKAGIDTVNTDLNTVKADVGAVMNDTSKAQAALSVFRTDMNDIKAKIEPLLRLPADISASTQFTRDVFTPITEKIEQLFRFKTRVESDNRLQVEVELFKTNMTEVQRLIQPLAGMAASNQRMRDEITSLMQKFDELSDFKAGVDSEVAQLHRISDDMLHVSADVKELRDWMDTARQRMNAVEAVAEEAKDKSTIANAVAKDACLKNTSLVQQLKDRFELQAPLARPALAYRPAGEKRPKQSQARLETESSSDDFTTLSTASQHEKTVGIRGKPSQNKPAPTRSLSSTKRRKTVDNGKLKVSAMLPGGGSLALQALPANIQALVNEQLDCVKWSFDKYVGQCVLCRGKSKDCTWSHQGTARSTACQACTNGKKPCMLITGLFTLLILPLPLACRTGYEPSDDTFWVDLERQNRWTSTAMWKTK